MAPRSRTGKLMQGLFGRFGKKTPEQSVVSNGNSRKQDSLRDGKAGRRSQLEVEANTTPSANDWDRSTPSDRDFPISSIFDDDEETNWDDAEALADASNSIVYAQPTAPVVTPPIPKTTLDLDNWDDALPAPTVKDRNIQEARRGTNPLPLATNDDIWDDDVPSDSQIPSINPQTFSANNADAGDRNLRESKPPIVNRAVGMWAGSMQQFRRILPDPIRKFADAIAIATIIAIVTVGIWFVDGFFVPSIKPSVATAPAAPVATQPAPTMPAQPPLAPQISPEQAFIDAITAQLSDITSQYPDDIVRSLSVDLARDRLIVQLNPAWYSIDDELQNSLTDRMWQQAQANHFSKLEIQDSQGISIARSPVVGKHPIILQRRQS
jgi:hypothetical protein